MKVAPGDVRIGAGAAGCNAAKARRVGGVARKNQPLEVARKFARNFARNGAALFSE
jgi:hypothetical protein